MSMAKPPRIAETEWEIMRAVWAGHPCTASDVIARIGETHRDWHPNTIKTLLARLVHKGALGYRQEGRAYRYSPRVTEEECQAAATESFVDRVFGGAFEPMLVHFVKRRKLSAAQVKQLKRLLGDKEA